MTKRFTSAKYFWLTVLAVVTVLCLSLSVALTFSSAYADGESTEPTPATGDTVTFHKHSECTVEGDVVAKIGDVEYTDLATAINSAADGQTVTLVKCVTGLTESIDINFSEAKSIVFDMCGHTVSGTLARTVGNALTEGLIVVQQTANVAAYIEFKNGTVINAADTIATTTNGMHGIYVSGICDGSEVIPNSEHIVAEFTNMQIETGGKCINPASKGYFDYIVNSGEYRSLKLSALASINGFGYNDSIAGEFESNWMGDVQGVTAVMFTGKGTTELYSYTSLYSVDDDSYKFIGTYSDAENVTERSFQPQEWTPDKFAGVEFSDGYTYVFRAVNSYYQSEYELRDLKLSIAKQRVQYFSGTNSAGEQTSYYTLEDAIADGCTEVSLLRDVSVNGYDGEKDIVNSFTIGADQEVTLYLNHKTFSAEIVNNGNLIIAGDNTDWDDHIFEGNITGSGKTSLKTYCVLRGKAIELLSGVITWDSTIALSPYPDDDTAYRVMPANVVVDGKGYISYNDAIKLGEREISITEADIEKNGYYRENLTIDIGENSTLTIDLCGRELRGDSNVDGSKVITVKSGNVIIKNGTVAAAYDNVSPVAMTFCVENNGGNVTFEGVTFTGGREGNGNVTTGVSQGALIRNVSGSLVLKDCTLYNSLVDANAVTDGMGVEVAAGNVKLDNVKTSIMAIAVYATGGSVEICGGTNLDYANAARSEKAGSLWVEDGVNVTIGVAQLYLNSKIDVNSFTLDEVHSVSGAAVNTSNATLTRYSFVAHEFAPKFVWSADFNTCTAIYECKYDPDCKANQSIAATVTSDIAGDCTNGGTITYTAKATFDGIEYTSDPQVVNVQIGHTFELIAGHPANKLVYDAFDTFDTTGLVIYRQCKVCGGERSVVAANNYTIEYLNGNCFHYGDDRVMVTAGDLTCVVSGLTVNKFDATLTWQYNRSAEAEDGWTNLAGATLVYDENAWYFRAVFVDKATEQTVVAEVARTALNAGDYNLTAAVAEFADYSFDNVDCVVTVDRQKINLADNTLFGFELALDNNNVEFWDGTVYVYDMNGAGKYPSMSLLDLTLPAYANWTLDETRTVVSSVARYRKDEAMSIAVRTDGELNADNKMFSYVISQGANPNADGIGVYAISVDLTATANYAFDTNFSESIYARGLSINIAMDNSTATVSKVWYVVQLDNWLVLADNADVEYDLDGWTYGQTVNKVAPALKYGDVASASFRLLDENRAPIDDPFKAANFNYYINSSMPAGSYYLEVTIPSLTVDGVTYKSATIMLGFDVAKATIQLNLDKDEEDGYLKYDWKLTANHEQFFAKFATKLADNANNVVLTKVQAQGYWATVASNDGYTVTYNLARMNSNAYCAISDNRILNAIKGGANATYTVYFQIEAANHNPLTAINNNRYGYFFTVDVYETLSIPAVSSAGLVYTGSKVLPDIAESDVYEAVWSATDQYINGGQHSVSFKLYDKVHYRWVDAQGEELTADTVTVNFTIAKATNDFTVALNMLGWNYETFDAAVNNIRAAAQFLDEGQSIRFRVVRKGETTALTGLSDFTIDANGKVNSTVAAALNALKVGEYTLYAKVDATDNYNVMERNVEFAVSKSINTWADGEDDLILPSWIVGKFDIEENQIAVKAAHGETIIEIRDIDGNVYYTSTKPDENTLNTLDVGKYLLVAWVEESDDYAPLAERSFTIEVLDKIGLPWWGTTLVTVGALAVAAAIILILWKLKVFEILTDKISLAITTRATVDATIAAVRATKRAEEAEAHKRKVEARERLEANREANRAKTPEQRAQELQAKAEETATKAEQMQARASKLQQQADKLSGKADSSETDSKADNPVDEE